MRYVKELFFLFVLSFLLFSCGKDEGDTKNQEEAGKTETDETLCEENNAECGDITIETGGGKRTVFCGECYKGYDCDNSINKCVGGSRKEKCDSKPENSLWNDDGAGGKFFQSWDGSRWVPETHEAVFSETPAECGFTCMTGFYFESGKNSCEKIQTRQTPCPDLPENAEWNDDGAGGTFTQTYEGKEWFPESHESTAGKTAGECVFKCSKGYILENDECVTAPERTVPCKGLPDNASWNTAESITQNSDGFDWIPADEGSYNEKPSTAECRFVCNELFFWSGSECINPCEENPCLKTENSDGVCTPFDFNVFVCGCNTGFRWNSPKKQCESNENAGKVTCTGQKFCYDSSERPCEEVQGSYFGQDAHYAELGFCIAMDFSVENPDSDEGIVIDNNTGLEWQQTIKGYNNFTWEAAKDYCSQLSYGGHDDWRLPTIEEFRTIIDYGGNGGGIDTSLFPIPTVCDFWTATPDTLYDDRGHWAADSRGGYGTNSDAFKYSARCVRKSWTPPVSKFKAKTENGAVIVIDSTTNLMWQGTVNEKDMSWYDALLYCENLTYAGYSDWRLPNIKELETILRFDKSDGTPTDFPDIPKWRYWSSSSYTLGFGHGWGLNIQYVSIIFVPKAYEELSALCVR